MLVVDDTYEETEHHVGPIQDHFLNQLSRANFYGAGSKYVPREPQLVDGKVKLNCVANVYQLESIEGSESRFTIKVRLYLFWELNYDEHPDLKQKYLELAEASEYYSLRNPEVKDLMLQHGEMFPMLKFFNGTHVEKEGEDSIRLYAGQNGGMIFWNYAARVQLKETFEFHEFPFDKQALSITLQQDNSINWDHFDLSVCMVQLHFDAIDQPEYELLSPSISRRSPKHRSTTVFLYAKRNSAYYVLNIFFVLAILSGFAFFVFLVEAEDVASRVNLVLTLMLTQVAFKFVTAGIVPRVGYSTHLDTYSFISIFFLVLVSIICAAQKLLASSLSDEASTNTSAGFLALFIYLSLMLGWGGSLCFQRNVDIPDTSTPIKFTKGTNWYAFNFSNAKFLGQKPDKSENKVKIDSGTAPPAKESKSTFSALSPTYIEKKRQGISGV